MVHQCGIKIIGDVAAYIDSVLVGVRVSHYARVDYFSMYG